MMVLGVIILVIAVIFISTQFTKGGKKYEEFTEQLDKCQGFMALNRYCSDECPAGKEVQPLSKEWADCGKGEFKGKSKCCVR